MDCNGAPCQRCFPQTWAQIPQRLEDCESSEAARFRASYRRQVRDTRRVSRDWKSQAVSARAFFSVRLPSPAAEIHTHKILLQLRELANATGGKIEKLVQLLGRVRAPLGTGLHLDEPAVPGHHDIHIHLSAGIFLVGEVEQSLVIHDSDAGCRNRIKKWNPAEHARGYPAPQGKG